MFLLLSVCDFSRAQTTNNDSVLAANYFNNEEYTNALKEYLKIYKTQKEDTAVNYKIGLCYLNINEDKSRAIPYLEYVYNKGGYRDELLMHLGMAYMYGYKFEDALTFFNYYRKIIHSKKLQLVDNYYEDALEGKVDYQKKITGGNFGKIDHLIENCESASEFVKSPINVTFENLGADINSKYPDYNPFVTQDEGTLYFTSRRGEGEQKQKSWQGYFTSDIYLSRVEEGQWSKVNKLGENINTPEDEECVYLSPDGTKMIMCEENASVVDDLFYVSLEAPKPRPFAYSEPINTAFREYQGCVSEDGNTMFIASDREGGLGETDIYMVKKLPTGDWGAPKNLGPNINTKYKEAFPVFDEKNNILYFASEGHVNIGGFDIFSSEYDPEENRFGAAINFGYPINTPEDNMELSFAANGRDAYISAYRNGGFGDLDIYKVTFNETEKRPSVIRGVISFNNHDSSKTEVDAMVILKDLVSNRTIDSKSVNPNTGRYIFAVETGKYSITIKSAGYVDVVKEINVYDKADYVFEIENDITLRQIGDTTTAIALPATTTIQAPLVSEIADKKPLVGVTLRGLVATNDLDTLQKDINISILLSNEKTKEMLEQKSVNLKNSEYSFSLKTGSYKLKVESEGYDTYVETIVIPENAHVFTLDKNVILKRAGVVSNSKVTETVATNVFEEQKKSSTVESLKLSEPNKSAKGDVEKQKEVHEEPGLSEENDEKPVKKTASKKEVLKKDTKAKSGKGAKKPVAKAKNTPAKKGTPAKVTKSKTASKGKAKASPTKKGKASPSVKKAPAKGKKK